jgi:hypothetical protein
VRRANYIGAIADFVSWSDAPSARQTPSRNETVAAKFGRFKMSHRFVAERAACQACLSAAVAKEERFALASKLTFRCPKNHEAVLVTSQSFVNPTSSRSLYEVNLRMVHGTISIGRGAVALYVLAGHLNMPLPCSFMNGVTWKTHESCIGGFIEANAKESASNALEEEIIQEKANNSHWKTVKYKPQGSRSAVELVGVPAGVDAGWCKRSSGRKYDSNGGVVAMVGLNSSKVIEFEVKIKLLHI